MNVIENDILDVLVRKCIISIYIYIYILFLFTGVFYEKMVIFELILSNTYRYQ